MVNERVLDRVLGLENVVKFLESAVLGLGHHEIEDRRLDGVPADEDDVGLPADLGEGDGPGELVEKTAGVDGESGESHALGAHLEREDLDGVQCLEGRETNGVDSAKDEDHSDGGAGGIAVGLAGLVVDTGRGCHADPNNARADHGEEHERAATNAVDECGTREGEGELEAGVSKVDVGLYDVLFVTGGVKHGGKEVREHTVASPLSEDREDDVGRDTVAAGAGVEERAVVPPALVSSLPVERLAS